MAVAALTMFAACDNSMYEYDQLFPDQYKRVVCIKQESKAQKELFNVGKDDYIDFTILRSGGIPELEASVNIEPMTQEELSQYSSSYVLASSDIFTLSASKLNFESGERYKTLRGTFPADGIEKASQAIAALEPGQILCAAFKITESGETSIDKEKNYIIRELSVNEPQLNFHFEGTYVTTTTTTLNVELPFANEDFEVTWDCEIKAADFSDMEPSTAFGNGLPAKYVAWSNVAPVVEGNSSMAAGETTATYTISLPAGTPAGIYDVQIKFGNAKLNGQKDMLTNYADKGEVYTHYIRFDTRTDNFIYHLPFEDSYPAPGTVLEGIKQAIPNVGMSFHPISSASDNPANAPFDGNVTSHWENRWSGGYGPKSKIPFETLFDLGAKMDVTALEHWRRNDSMRTDTKTVELYAAENADYSNRESHVYEGLVYLGTYEYGSIGDRMMILEFPRVNTQYIVMRFTGSNRSNAVNINEIRFWN